MRATTLVLQRLVKKLGLIEEVGDFGVAKVEQKIQPTTSIDDLLAEPKIYATTFNAVAGGWVNAFTVPDGKKWKLITIYFNRTSGSTSTVQSIRVNDNSNHAQFYTYATPDNSDAFYLNNSIHLNTQWILQVYTTAGTDPFEMSILVEESDSY